LEATSSTETNSPSGVSSVGTAKLTTGGHTASRTGRAGRRPCRRADKVRPARSALRNCNHARLIRTNLHRDPPIFVNGCANSANPMHSISCANYMRTTLRTPKLNICDRKNVGHAMSEHLSSRAGRFLGGRSATMRLGKHHFCWENKTFARGRATPAVACWLMYVVV
jgi:hypothetical protein